MAHYVVYTLQRLKDGRYYIGETSNTTGRLNFHNPGKQRSAKNRISFRLVLTEEYKTRNRSSSILEVSRRKKEGFLEKMKELYKY